MRFSPKFITRSSSEVGEVSRSALSVIIVVASRWLGARLVRIPGGMVAVPELRSGASRVDVVSEGEDRTRYVGQHFGRGFVAVVPARCDVTSVAVVVGCPTTGTAAVQASSTAKAIEANSRPDFIIYANSLPLWGRGRTMILRRPVMLHEQHSLHEGGTHLSSGRTLVLP